MSTVDTQVGATRIRIEIKMRREERRIDVKRKEEDEEQTLKQATRQPLALSVTMIISDNISLATAFESCWQPSRFPTESVWSARSL